MQETNGIASESPWQEVVGYLHRHRESLLVFIRWQERRLLSPCVKVHI